jgi:hypothetical protein
MIALPTTRRGIPMKTMIKGAMLVAVATLGLSVAACDSKQENAQEMAADAVRNQSDASADMMEASAEATGGMAADVREMGDKKADAMEDKADKKDKAPE